MYYSKKSSRVKRFKRFWTYKNVFKTEIAKSNIKLMMFFNTFIHKFFLSTNYDYPYFNFYYRSSVRFLTFVAYFFVKKKALFFYKKFLQIISLYLNIFLNVKIFIISKKTVTAQFLVNYLCFGFKHRESFKYLMKPIRIILTKLMHSKEKILRDLVEDDYRAETAVPLAQYMKHDIIHIFNALKIKRIFLIKKLMNVYYNYKISIVESSYIYILVKFKRKHKYKHFNIKSFIFYNCNILKSIKFYSFTKINCVHFKTVFENKNEKKNIYKRYFLNKKIVFLLTFYQKKYKESFNSILFFLHDINTKLKNNFKKSLIKHILFILNLNLCFLSTNYIKSESKNNIVIYDNKQFLFKLIMNLCIYLYNIPFVHILFEERNLEIE
jgi:hypothetical protein